MLCVECVVLLSCTYEVHVSEPQWHFGSVITSYNLYTYHDMNIILELIS